MTQTARTPATSADIASDIRQLQTDLLAAQADAGFNTNAADAQVEGDRVRAALNLVDFIAAKLDATRELYRVTRRGELATILSDAKAARESADASAMAEDASFRDAVVAAVSVNFVPAAGEAVNRWLSASGDTYRATAAAAQGVIDAAETELAGL